MRKILPISAVLVFGFSILTACQNTETTKTVEKANTNTSTTTTNTVVNTNAAKTPETANSNQKVDSHGHVDNAERITLADAKKEFDAGNAVFIDTRDEASFKQEHIKGAMNIPMNNLIGRLNDIPKGKKVIAYCS